MRWLRWLLLPCLLGLCLPAQAQQPDSTNAGPELPRETSPLEPDPIRIDQAALQEEMKNAPGMDKYTLGIDLLKQSGTRIYLVDDTSLAVRELRAIDRPALRGDSLRGIAAGTTYWMRFPILPAPEMKGVPVALNVIARIPFELYLNGVPVLQAARRPLGRSGPMAEETDFHPMVVQVTFACDGKPEMLAARVQSLLGDSPVYPPLRLVLQSPDVGAAAPRLTMHYGIFFGVNLAIALLAFITWGWDRRDRSWLLLAWLAVLSALIVVCEMGASAFLGFSRVPLYIMQSALPALLAWSMLLILLVLRRMRGDAVTSFVRVLIGLGILLTLSTVAFEVMGFFGMDVRWARVPFIVLAVATFIGLAGEMVRSAVRVSRAGGLERWFGYGTLLFVGLTALMMLTEAVYPYMSTFSWVGIAGQYIFHLCVPASVATYLALRSAKNNRLVARQRDELDLEVHERTAELRHEKERSDGLLRNILPEEVAEELKAKGEADAKQLDLVTVLFTDFKGFTAMSEKLSPKELVRDIHECFSAFDHIMARHGIEKIKTIGDAYMAAGGLPTPNTTHAPDVVKAALEIRDFIAEGKARKVAAGLPFFEIRIGIHTGPVVAGIVGVKKFAYDIWGDTVNTASRMESSGEVGQVNISESTYALVRGVPAFSFTSRGTVEAKGKGVLAMWFVDSAS